MLFSAARWKFLVIMKIQGFCMLKLLLKLDDWIDSRTQMREIKRLQKIADAAKEYTRNFGHLVPEAVAEESRRLRERLRASPADAAELQPRALAIGGLAVERVLGFAPNSTQIIGALLMVEGNIIEMHAGEGKTVVATLAAYWQFLLGHHTDITTTNDYLATRDQRWMGLVFGFLGASVGLIISTTPRPQRRAEYQKDVTYVANQELGFDYLRDHLETNAAEEVSGAFDFVIIDEADSILIDEARTSLIITEPRELGDEAGREYQELKKLILAIKQLSPGSDYTIDYRLRTTALTEAGADRLVHLLGRDFFKERDVDEMDALWYALYASVFLQPERDYIIRGDKVILINEFTGHAMPDRVLLEGLQRAVEAKAGIPPSKDHSIVASVTYSNFFHRFKKVSGMTGTAFAAREEFYNLYGLRVARLLPHRGALRKDKPTIFFRTEKEKFDRVVWESLRAKAQGAPLLIVGRSIAAAKQASDLLEREGISHQLLHAEVGEEESAIIQAAGRPGMITVATNMAGRGADIVIDETLRYRNGLRVLGLQHNLSRRVDEQLRGRAGRQGQMGETIIAASLEDELFQAYGDDDFWDRAEKLPWPAEGISDEILQAGVFRAQDEAEEISMEARSSLARFDLVVDAHREATYRLRQRILETDDFFEFIADTIRRILIVEEYSAVRPRDLKKILYWSSLDADLQKKLSSFLFWHRSLEPRRSRSSYPQPYDEAKKAILSVIDSRWEGYLESAYWLMDWISMTSAAGRDPYIEFARTADRMFHDMRRDFAITALRAILKLI